jgi:hypothetical protein
VIERHKCRDVAPALKYAYAAFEIREIGSVGKVSLFHALRSPRASELLNNTTRFRPVCGARRLLSIVHRVHGNFPGFPAYLRGRLALL